jgi:hypothetical protein
MLCIACSISFSVFIKYDPRLTPVKHPAENRARLVPMKR